MNGKARFTDFSGDILDLISEYLPQTSEISVPPVFALCNSIVLKSYCEYKRENYGIQIEILIDQIGELKRELFEYFDQKLFKMSKNLSIIYQSFKTNWRVLSSSIFSIFGLSVQMCKGVCSLLKQTGEF